MDENEEEDQDEDENVDENKYENEDEDEDEDVPIHQSLSARLRSTAFTGGSKSVTRKLGNDQNFTHFCRFAVNTFGFKNAHYFVSVVIYFLQTNLIDMLSNIARIANAVQCHS